jgi:hypothetical protein
VACPRPAVSRPSSLSGRLAVLPRGESAVFFLCPVTGADYDYLVRGAKVRWGCTAICSVKLAVLALAVTAFVEIGRQLRFSSLVPSFVS